jgi:phosphoribosylformylglycinamidine synthase
MKYEIIVQLKEDVLDPEGRAIRDSLNRLGFNSLENVTVTKRYLVAIKDDESDPDGLALRLAKEYLANPVAEIFTVNRL